MIKYRTKTHSLSLYFCVCHSVHTCVYWTTPKIGFVFPSVTKLLSFNINCFIYKMFRAFWLPTTFTIMHAVLSLPACFNAFLCGFVLFAGLINYNIDVVFGRPIGRSVYWACFNATEKHFSKNVHLIERKLQQMSVFCERVCVYVYVSAFS